MTFQRILHFAPISPIEFHITTVFKERKKRGKNSRHQHTYTLGTPGLQSKRPHASVQKITL